MLNNIGNLLLILSLILTILIIYNSWLSIRSKTQSINLTIFKLALWQITFTVLCFFSLLIGFILSDFSLSTVYENSHTTKPLFYKIVGAWGNHEGSLLLWVNILVIFSYLFLIFNAKINKNYVLYTLFFQNILILGFVIFLIIDSNPFYRIYPIPLEGLGLNPILQDPALAIHPPLLYIGFVGSSIYFSAALGSLVSDYRGKIFAKSVRSWVQLTWCFQTLGIIVGSIWAYYELGWGGFWFWDPVENSSLMPWFIMTSLLHSLIVLEKRNSNYSWVIVLCLLTFSLSVAGTFLVRSGILNSVHTFASDPSRGIYILSFLSLMVFSSLLIFFKNHRHENFNYSLNSKETFILANNWFMIFFLVTVLIGTIYPIFLEVFTGKKISVGPPYYNLIIIPLLVPFLFFMAVAPNISWIRGKIKIIPVILISLSAIFLNFIIFFFSKKYNLLSNLIFIAAFFLITHSLFDLKNIITSKIKYKISRVVSHLGFAFLVFFIGINHQFSTEHDFNLKVGQSKKFKIHEIYFSSLEKKVEKNYTSIIGNFKYINSQKKISKKLNPEIRIYNNPETLTYEAAIKTKLTTDIYLTMSNISRSEYYNIKFQDRPFMIWIWISGLLIAFGGFIRLMNRNN